MDQTKIITNPVMTLLSEFDNLYASAIETLVNDYKIQLSTTILYSVFDRLRIFFHNSNFNLHQFKDLLSAILECHKELFIAMILAVNEGCDITKIYFCWKHSYIYPTFVIYHRYCALTPNQCACSVLYGYCAYNINKIIFTNKEHERKIKNYILNKST